MLGTTKVAGATALAGAAAAGLAACPPVEDKAEWPFDYPQLDIEAVRRAAYISFHFGGCCYGAYNGIVVPMRAAAPGGPFDDIPTDNMRYGGGGAAGFGSLCGTLNGAAAAIGLTVGADQAKLVGALIEWYGSTLLPTAASSDMAINDDFTGDLTPEQRKYPYELGQTISGSNLCHVSVTTWCRTLGFNEADIERVERCARVTADVAVKAAEILNAYHAAGTIPTYVSPAALSGCMACHDNDEVPNAPVLEQVNGKMNCSLCHETENIPGHPDV